MRNKTIVVSVLLAVIMLISCLFAACGNKGNNNADNTKPANPGNSDSADTNDKNDKDDKDDNNNAAPAGEDFDLKKTNDADLSSFDGWLSLSRNGFTYTKDGKAGVISADGKKDTGAVYANAAARGSFFWVKEDVEENTSDASTINNSGLIDSEGNVIVPMQYALIKVKDDRFAQAYTAKALTDNKDEALIFATDRLLAVDAADKDLLYTGEWVVYDLQTKEIVPGVTGTKPTDISAYGDIISYSDDSGNRKYADAKGNAMPENGTYFFNGCYEIYEDDKNTVYDENQKQMFTYTDDEYDYFNMASDKYFEAGSVKDNERYVLDRSGKKLSVGFEKSIDVYGDLVLSDGKVYDFNGTSLFDKTIIYLDVDAVFGCYYIAKADDGTFFFFKADGTVLYSGVKDTDGLQIDDIYFAVYKQVDGKNLYYSFADGDFTLQGTTVCTGMIEVENEDETCTLYSAFTGKKLLEGYEDFYLIDDTGFDTFKLLAEKEDGIYEYYQLH